MKTSVDDMHKGKCQLDNEDKKDESAAFQVYNLFQISEHDLYRFNLRMLKKELKKSLALLERLTRKRLNLNKI